MLEAAEILYVAGMESSPGAMTKPGGGVSGDGPVHCFATKQNESCADEREN